MEKFENSLNLIETKYTESKITHENLREAQRQLIVIFLISEGFITYTKNNFVSKRPTSGGKGYSKYKNEIFNDNPFDLSSYKYIETTKDGFNIFISLQPPDQDNVSKNRHTLIDRIGFRVASNNESITESRILNFEEIILTEIDLPMNIEKLNQLIDLINKEVEKKKNLKL